MTTAPESPEETCPAPEPTETLGSLLRRARQDKRVALEMAAKDTRIHATTLKALEEDARGELPAEVFTRGFIKIYAQYLGLDPDAALQVYLRHRGEKTAIPDEKVNVQEVLAGETMADPPTFHAERHLFTAAVVILVSLILYLGYKITAPPPPEPPESAPIAEPQTPPPTAMPETLPPVEQTAQQEPPTAETLPAPPAPASTAVPPPLAPPPAQTLPVVAPAVVAKTTPVPPAALPKPAAPATPPPTANAPRQTMPGAPVAQAQPMGPPVVQPGTAKVAAQPVPPPAPAATSSAAATTKAPLKELAPPGPIKKEKTDKTAATPTAAETAKPAKEPSTAEKLIAAIKPMRPPYALEAAFREDTWVRVQVDGEKPKPQYFRAGEKSAWQANSKIQLFIGNAGGVDLVLNNTKLPPLGKPGNTTRISIQPQPDQR